jgi:hypothetical protein
MRRYRAVERALDDNGRRLRLYCTNPEGFADRRLAAFVPDVDNIYLHQRKRAGRIQVEDLKRIEACKRGFCSSEDDWKYEWAIEYATMYLQREYTRYSQRKPVRGRPVRASLVMTREALERATFVRGEEFLDSLISGPLIEPATWEHWRVSVEAAEEILRNFNYESTDELFFALMVCGERPLPRRAPPPDLKAWFWECWRQERKEYGKHGFPSFSEWLAEAYEQRRLAVPNDLLWDSSRFENELGAETTTVRRLAKELKGPSSEVRRLLVQHGCDEARDPRKPIPVAWLHSEAGKRFWAAGGGIYLRAQNRKQDKTTTELLGSGP